MNILEDGNSLGHYRIVSKIGAGGMGEVYLAEDTKLDRKVALKILPSEFAEDKDRMSRFVREARSASALNHPNIITIHEIGESEGTHYIATEFIDGKTLNEYAKSNHLNFKSALEIAIQIASALDEAHAAGIVHRDIKPDNVMIRASGLVKILDFGIAKLSEKNPANVSSEDATAIKSGTTPGMIIGTPNYMSPEQAKGKDVDARTDIFSFGVVLYQMIAGHLPFEGETAMEMIGAILKDEPKPLDKTEVTPELEKIIGKCLRKDRNERYQTIKDVLIDVQDVKQDLEFQDKLERTVSPEKEEPKTQMLKATTVDESNQTTTNENRNDSITLKKSNISKLAIGAIAVLLVSLIGAGYWFYRENNSKQIESIAVMPFVNESGNQDVEYLSDGMTETLIGSLSQIPKLNVKARSSVFRYKGKEIDLQKIAQELNVQAILNGRVAQRGEQLLLNLELVDAQTENVIWSEQYNRRQADLISLQSDVARDVANKLKAKLSSADERRLTKSYTENAEAYQLYLKGRYHWSKRAALEIHQAIEYFKQTISADPNFALAYAGLADCYSLIPIYDNANFKAVQTMPLAKEAVLKALSIDDELPEAHASLALINDIFDWYTTSAEKHYKRAIELNPKYATAHQWYGEMLCNLGRFDEGLGESRRAIELEPFLLIANLALGNNLLKARRYDEAIKQLERTLELSPNYVNVNIFLFEAYAAKGAYAQAVAAYVRQKTLEGEPAAELEKLQKEFDKNGWQGFLKQRIRYIESGATQYDDSIYAMAGELDKAMRLLEKKFDEKDEDMTWLLVAPRYDNLRDDARFQDLVKRVGFAD